MRFMKHYQGLKYRYIKRDDLERAIEEIERDGSLFGVSDFLKRFKESCSMFATKYHSCIKGIILFGPPGTGKSAISGSFCKKAGMVFATDPITPADLDKGLKGDKGAMINAIADRARIVPWELVVLLVDEIDRLAPDRASNDGGGDDESSLGVFLSLQDGVKQVKNFKVIGSTNFLYKIDEAFRRRMDVQLFLGNPNKSAREQWIVPMARKSIKDKNHAQYVKSFVEEVKYRNLRQDMINYSINFSADGWRGFLEKFFETLLNSNTILTKDNYERMMLENLKIVAQTTNVELGNNLTFEILKKLKDIEGSIIKQDEKKFRAFTAGQMFVDECGNQMLSSKKALVQLSSKNERECFQFHCKNLVEVGVVECEELCHFISTQECEETSFSDFRCFALYMYGLLRFPKVNHIIDKYNKVRENLKQDKEFNRIERNWKDIELKTILNGSEENLQLDLQDLYKYFYTMKVQAREILNNFIESVEQRYSKEPSVQTFRLLLESESIRENWLPLLLDFALEYDAEMIKLIDHNYLQKKKAFDDTTAQKEVNAIIEETRRYNKTVVIFDLDSIAQISKQYSSLKTDLDAPNEKALEGNEEDTNTFTYHLEKPKTLADIIQAFKSLSPVGPCWFFAVASNNKLLADFKRELKWPKTKSDHEYEEKQRELDQYYYCERCRKLFTERQNMKGFDCGKHESDTILFEDPDLEFGQKRRRRTLYKVDEALRKCDNIKYFASDFKYTCCEDDLRGRNGCIACRHIPGHPYVEKK